MAKALPRIVVSGGQTGVDLAALDAALAAGLSVGGWVPRGRTNEAGPIPALYPDLREAPSADPAVRTDLNVRDSDATLILTRPGVESPGTDLTARCARAHGKPYLTVTLTGDPDREIRAIDTWLNIVQPLTLNVAGPRESSAPAIGATARMRLDAVLKPRAR